MSYSGIRFLAPTLVVCAGVCAACCAADEKNERVDLKEHYRCEGGNPQGGKYEGTVSITPQRDTYLVRWEIGQQKQTGLGILDGDLFSVSWAAHGPKGVEAMGIVIYRVRDQGEKLVGRWAQMPGDGRTFTEILTPRGNGDAPEESASPVAGAACPPAALAGR